MLVFFKQFAAAITYELEWTFVKGEESNLKWQKSICKEAKDTNPLIHHSPVCSEPFTNTTAPLSASSGGQRGYLFIRYIQGLLHQNSREFDGIVHGRTVP